MDFLTILIIVVVIGLILAIVSIVGNVNHKKKSKEIFENLADFDTTDKYFSETSGISIGYDENRKKYVY